MDDNITSIRLTEEQYRHVGSIHICNRHIGVRVRFCPWLVFEAVVIKSMAPKWIWDICYMLLGLLSLRSLPECTCWTTPSSQWSLLIQEVMCEDAINYNISFHTGLLTIIMHAFSLFKLCPNNGHLKLFYIKTFFNRRTAKLSNDSDVQWIQSSASAFVPLHMYLSLHFTAKSDTCCTEMLSDA